MDSRLGPSTNLGGMDAEIGLDALRESAEFRGPVEPLDDHDHANGHFALIYESTEERLAATVPFLRQGLERGEQCLFVLEDPAERDMITEALRDRGVDVDGALESDALTFHSVDETYLRSEPFDPDEMIAFYQDVIEDLDEGMRVAAGTDWIEDVPLETFMEYEGRVNALFDDHDAIAMCQYDRRTLSAEVIRDVVRTHPHLIYDDSVCHNFYYTPPDEILDAADSDAETDRMLRTLQDRTEAKTELAEHKRFLRELTEVTSHPDLAFAEQVQALLNLGCERFGLELGVLATVDRAGDRLQVDQISGDHTRLEAGGTIPLSAVGAIEEVVERAASLADPIEGVRARHVFDGAGDEAYLGAYLPIEGGQDRTLVFHTDGQRDRTFSEEARTHVELMGQWVTQAVERRQHERHLERSKRRFQRIFENSQDAIFITDPYADEILEANPAGSEMLGYAEAEILARGPSDFHPDEMARFQAFVDEVYETGAGWTDELTCLHRDGHRIPVELSASRIEYDGRQCLLAIVRDISDRKERQRELERAERQFEATFNNPVSFMGLLDPDGTVRRINENARRFVGVDNAAVAGEKFWETPWFEHSAEIQEKLRDAVARAADGEYVQAEVPHESPDGDIVVMDAMLEPVRDDDGEVVTLLASGHDITERVRHERRLQDAYEIIADPDRSFREQVDALLELGRETLGTDYGTLSRIQQDTGEYIFEQVAAPADADLEAGDTTALEATNCERVVSTRENLVLRDVDGEAPGLADRAGNAEWGISCYMGTPVMADDEVYGTFCFYDMEARSDEFSDWEVTFVDLLANWVGSELERQRDTDRIEALNHLNGVARDITRALADQSTGEDIERVVCERLAASDSYGFAWIGTVDEQAQEVVPRTVNAQGEFDEVEFESADARECPAKQALRTGEVQVVRDVDELSLLTDRDGDSEDALAALAMVPVLYEDETHGVLTVHTTRKGAFEAEEREVLGQLGEITGLTLTAIEREERLELINRLLRHNLLNGLNLVNARLDMLQGHVDYEVTEHLDTTRDRTSEMIDLIETLRALTEGLVEDDYDLEAVDLGRTLRAELDRAGEAYDRAVFEAATDLDALPAVRADGLLEEVFENLLVNAVRHNDKETPRVTVEADVGEEAVTVHVSDNGPGIPDHLRESIFEKGEKGFDSPGTGFGLHLAREIVNVYDGAIAVEDNDPEGTVFSITLPRAEL